MNERIKEIAESVGITKINQRSDGAYVLSPATVESFADVIIKECMDHVNWVGKINENTSVSPTQTAHAINKRITNHLGVN